MQKSEVISNNFKIVIIGESRYNILKYFRYGWQNFYIY